MLTAIDYCSNPYVVKIERAVCSCVEENGRRFDFFDAHSASTGDADVAIYCAIDAIDTKILRSVYTVSVSACGRIGRSEHYSLHNASCKDSWRKNLSIDRKIYGLIEISSCKTGSRSRGYCGTQGS